MPAKRFAALMLVDTQWKGVYTVPAGYEATMTVAVVNHGTNDAHVWLAITDEADPADTRPEETIVARQLLGPGQSRWFRVVAVAENLTLGARADVAGAVSVTAFGFEEQP